MSAFEAGALVWKIQTVGAEIFRRDQKDAQEAFDKTGDAASKSAKKVSEQGTATDKASESARKTKKPLDEQAEATRKAAEEAAKAERAAKEHAAALEKQRAAAKQLGAALLIAGAATAAMVTLAVVKHTEFDQAMSNTSAAIMATREEQELLSEAALQAGADTAYSATEAAAAQEELAKAGMSVTSVVKGGLNGALSLAAAGQLAVARSAEIMATTLTQFQLPASKAAHVADLLAAGAGKAQGSVEDMGLALSYVGPLANSVGWSIEQTAGTIAYFATQGIIGEKAGTALRGVMAGLQAPSAAAQKVMDQYGITVYDASGKMKSASGLAEEFKTKLGGLTDQERQAAMGRIFGNESLLAATLLYQGGAEAIDEWTDNVNDAGYAAEQAAMRQDNLAGDIEKLGGSFETVLIKQGSGVNDVLRQMTQALTGLVDLFGEAPDAVQATVITIGATAAAALLAAGAAITLRARFNELRDTLDGTGVSFKKTALLGAAAGVALTGVTMIVGTLLAAHAEGQAKAQSYADTLEEGTRKITDATRDMIAANLAAKGSFLWIEQDSVFDAADKLGISLELVQKAAEGNAAAIRELDEALEPFNNSNNEAENWAARVAEGVKGEADSLEQAADMAEKKERATENMTGANEDAAPVAQSAAEAYLAEADGIEKLNDEIDQLLKSLFEANDLNRDAITASNDYTEAMWEVNEVVRKATEGIDENEDGIADHTLTLDTNTQAGVDNMNMLVELSKKAEDAAAAQFALDGDTQVLTESLKTAHQQLMDTAIAMGYDATQAENLANKILGIPDEAATKIMADTIAARDAVQEFSNKVDAIPSFKTVTVQVSAQQTFNAAASWLSGLGLANGGHVEFYANGGHRWENRIAQHAKAGDYRIWAEPETGGETYIPHALSKRARSTQILGETADLFGYTLVPKGAAQFADGSAVAAVSAATPMALEGIAITGRLEIGGDGLARIIDGRIVSAMPSAGAVTSRFGGR